MPIARRVRLASAAALSFGFAFARCSLAQNSADSVARATLVDYQNECRADGGALWGRSLCGPILLVEPQTRHALAPIKPPGGAFSLISGVWVGTIPPGIPVSNTSLDWAGVEWAFVLLPMAGNRTDRVSTLLHESFHRIEDSLALGGGDPMLPHLDERDGRYWLRLELRAIAAAVQATGKAGRQATRDAMLFRARRVALYPGSDTLEDLVERHEGMAEYTGTVLALAATNETVASTARLFTSFETRPTFVRALGYGTGPGLGLLLDRYAEGWRKRMANRSLAGMLSEAVNFSVPADLAAAADRRAVQYNAAGLAAEENVREERRQARLADLRARLVTGPVLELHQDRLSRSFNPNTLIAFGELGTVYPTGAFSGEWGALTVDSGGALVAPDYRLVRVALPADTAGGALVGRGWRLELNPGWTLGRGTRTEDLVAVPPGRARP